MNTISFDFTGSNVLVTGGTSGIGNAIATSYAKAGAAVTITGTKAGADDYDVELGGFRYLQCRMAETSDIDGVLEAVDRLDVLVNNAGQNFPGGKDEWDPEGYAAAVAVNMLGPMRLTMGCHDKLKASTAEGGASVISVVSMSAFRSAVSVPGYSSSKAGMVALTKNLSRRWVRDGIRVNTVAPGLIDTPMTHLAFDIPQVVDVEIGFHTPMGRGGTAEEIADAVLFLSSSGARYITGASLAVDGGYLTV